MWPCLVSVFVLVWGAVVLAMKTGLTASVEKAVEMKFRQWEVRFTSLHERRIEVTGEMQERLVAVKQALDFASGIQPMDDPHGFKHLGAVIQTSNEARRYFESRRYLFPKETAGKIEDLLTEMKAAWANLQTGAEGLARGSFAPVNSSLVAEGYSIVRKRLPPLIQEVEEEFRKLVGS